MQTTLEGKQKDLCESCKVQPCNSRIKLNGEEGIQHITTVKCKDYRKKWLKD